MPEFDEKEMLGRNVLNKLNKAAAEAQPKFAGKFEAKAAAAGIETVAAAPSVEGFCAICARVRPFLNMAIKAFGMFNPALGQMAKTFMAVIYGTLVPMICGPAPTP